jgi:hypothetical protein
MRRSVVSNRSKPASSAASNSAPLLRVPQPLDCAVCTVCPGSGRTSFLGVPWSKRTTTGRNRFGAQALGYEVEYGFDLFARHVEPLNDLVDAQIFQVLDDSGNGQTSALEHPGIAHLARNTLDGRARQQAEPQMVGHGDEDDSSFMKQLPKEARPEKKASVARKR